MLQNNAIAVQTGSYYSYQALKVFYLIKIIKKSSFLIFRLHTFHETHNVRLKCNLQCLLFIHSFIIY